MDICNSNSINFDHITELQDQLGFDNMVNLFLKFNQELDALMVQISIIEPGSVDFEKLIGKVHQSAGSAAALGIIGIHRQLNLVETLAKSGKWDALRSELERLTTTWQVIKITLNNNGLLEN